MTDKVIFDNSRDKVADTSKNAYKDLDESGDLSRQSRQVLDAIKAMDYAPTLNELVNSPLAGWEKSTVSGRLGDLRDADRIFMAGKRDDRWSGRTCKTWMERDL